VKPKNVESREGKIFKGFESKRIVARARQQVKEASNSVQNKANMAIVNSYMLLAATFNVEILF
jgi:hypothetical protein